MQMRKGTLWLGLSVLLVAALLLVSCGKREAAGEAATPEPEAAEAVETAEFPILGVGETYQTAEMEVTISEAVLTDSYEYSDKASGSTVTKEANPGVSFLIASVEMKNVGDSVQTMQGADVFRAVDAEGSSKTVLPYLGEGPLVSIQHLQPGTKIEGKMLFEMPEGASDVKIQYKTMWQVLLAEWEIR